MAGTPYPRFDPNWITGICQLGPRPLVTTGWLRLWLTGHFQQDNLDDQDQAVQKMLWKPDNTTGILIESITRFIPDMVELRPAVIIKRNGWKRLRLGIGDRMMGTAAPDGQERFGNAWQGSHTLFCIAGKGAEAEKLGAEVYGELNKNADTVRSLLDLLRFEVTEVAELMILDEARQNFVVPVVVAYAFMEGWIRVREAPVLRTVDLALWQP